MMNRYELDNVNTAKLFEQLDKTIAILELISGEWDGDDGQTPLGIRAVLAVESIESMNAVKETLKELL